MSSLPRLWTEQDDSTLRTMAADGNRADQIARRLDRHSDMVKRRARVLGVKLPSLQDWRRARGLPPNGHAGGR